MLLHIRRDSANRLPRGVVDAGDEDAPCSTLEHRSDNSCDLVGRLPLGEHRFGSALPELAVQVDAGKAEVVIRQRREPLERRGRLHVTPADGLKQRLELGP